MNKALSPGMKNRDALDNFFYKRGLTQVLSGESPQVFVLARSHVRVRVKTYVEPLRLGEMVLL